MADTPGIQAQKTHLKQAYKKYRSRQTLWAGGLIPLLLVIVGGSITFGSADIAFWDVYRTITERIFPAFSSPVDRSADIIIWQLRLPRIVMGVLTGIALGVSGAAMQIILRNPLADPYMLGVASAAGFGASLAIIFGIGIGGGAYLIIGNAFLFSLAASILILVLSGVRGGSPEKMVLTGLALLFFFQAMTTLLQYFGEAEAVKAAVFWTVGDLGKTDWPGIVTVFPVVVLGTGVLVWKSNDFNIMNTGDACAKSLGVNVEKTRILAMLVCTLMVAAVVSFTGTIGFIGLVAPHLVRMTVGDDSRILVPGSGLVGAVLLVFSDTVARSILGSVILPVGAVTAFFGVPLFLYLIIRKKGGLL